MFELFAKLFSNYLENNSLKRTNRICMSPKTSALLAKVVLQGKVEETNLNNYPVVSQKHYRI